MSDLDELSELVDEVSSLDRRLSSMDTAMIAGYQEIMVHMRQFQRELEDIRAALALAQKPDEESLKKHKTLRDAYEQYQFVKRLTLYGG